MTLYLTANDSHQAGLTAIDIWPDKSRNTACRDSMAEMVAEHHPWCSASKLGSAMASHTLICKQIQIQIQTWHACQQGPALVKQSNVLVPDAGCQLPAALHVMLSEQAIRYNITLS